MILHLAFVTFLITKTYMRSGLGYNSIENFIVGIICIKGVLSDLFYSINTPTSALNARWNDKDIYYIYLPLFRTRYSV